MKARYALLGAGIAAAVSFSIARADYVYRDGNGNLQTTFAFVCQSVKICPAMALMDSTGVEKATPGNPLRIDPVGTTPQPITGTVSVTGNSQPTLGTTTGWNKILLHALTTTVVPVKASAGQLAELHCYNPNAAVAYVQVFDNAAPVLGTTLPNTILGIPQTTATSFSAQGIGVQFATAINVAATTTATGSTANTTGLECSAFFF